MIIPFGRKNESDNFFSEAIRYLLNVFLRAAINNILQYNVYESPQNAKKHCSCSLLCSI